MKYIRSFKMVLNNHSFQRRKHETKCSFLKMKEDFMLNTGQKILKEVDGTMCCTCVGEQKCSFVSENTTEALSSLWHVDLFSNLSCYVDW